VFEAAETIIASPVVREGTAYVRSASHLYAVDTATGQTIWEASSPGGDGLAVAPLVLEEMVVVPEAGSGLATFSRETGELLWRADPPWGEKSQAIPSSIESLAAASGRLYVARLLWQLAVHDLASGQALRGINAPLDNQRPVVLADQERLYLATEHKLSVYDRRGRSALSTTEFEGGLGPILLSKGTLFVADEGENAISAFDTSEGGLNALWTARLPDEFARPDVRCLALRGEVLYVAADRLLALSARDGNPLWTSAETGPLECPLPLRNRVYVRDTGGTLYALDRETGAEAGRLALLSNRDNLGIAQGFRDSGHFRGPAAAGRLLLVPFGDNRLFAYRP
jgi:outer membrane protein assembly factor BamB